MLTAAFVFKGMIELCMMFLIGQGALWCFMLLVEPAKRSNNPVYGLMQVVTRPLMGMARLLSPRFLSPSHLGLYAFGLLLVIWILTIMLALPALCSEAGLGVAQCRAASGF